MELADLIISAGSQTNEAPDPKVDPAAALDFHRDQWPLNSKVAEGTLATLEGSARLRLRRVASHLSESGFSVSGAERASSVRGAQISLSAYFDQTGDCGRVDVEVTTVPDKALALGIIQEALQGQGFGALVTINQQITIIKSGSAKEVRYLEAGGTISSYYGQSKAIAMTGDEYLTWGCRIYGIQSDQIVSWKDLGCDADQAIIWAEAGARGSYEAKDWMGCGQSPSQAKAWRDANLPAHAAQHWITDGLTVADAKPWSEVGLVSRDQVRDWQAEGFDADTASPYLSLRGVSNPQQVRLLLDGKVSIINVERLAAAGISLQMISKIADWTARYKIELDEAIQWAALGAEFIGPGKRGRWHKAGYTPETIQIWQAALNKRQISLDEVRALRATGFDPQTAQDWAAIHSSLAASEMSSLWVQAGFSPDQAKPWVELSDGFTSFELVKSWLDEDLGVEDARSWAEAAEKFDRRSLLNHEIVRSWESADARCSNPELVAELSAITTPELLPKIIELLN